MGYKEFQLLMLFWNLGLVDTFSVVKLCVNSGSQYIGIVLFSAAVEKRQRIATLASFFAASGEALTNNPNTNTIIGGVVASKISYMKAILARGDSSQIQQYILILSLQDFVITANSIKTSIATPRLNSAQMQFYKNCNIITRNIFAEQTVRSYANSLAQKGSNLLPFLGSLVIQASTQGSIASLIGYSYLGIGISVIMIYGGLCMIHNAKKKHHEMVVKHNERVIDVTAIEID